MAKRGRKPMGDLKSYALRIPPELFDKIQELAEEDDRSINVYITRVLKEHVEASDKK